MTSWRILDAADHTGPVTYRRGRVVLGGNSAALADLAVVLLGPGCEPSAGLFAALARFDVTVAHTDWRSMPVAVTSTWTGHSRIASRQRAQAELSRPRSKSAWQKIVRAKIQGQANTLSNRNPPVADGLRHLSRKVRSGDPDNIEARAARVYWHSMSQRGSFSRLPRHEDATNQALDYGYAILRVRVIRAIVASGLSPTLGLWHRTRDNAFVLADDLMEPFRAAVDDLVFTSSMPNELTPELKHALVSVLQTPVRPGQPTIATAMDTLAGAYAHYAEGELDRLPVPVWKPGRCG